MEHPFVSHAIISSHSKTWSHRKTSTKQLFKSARTTQPSPSSGLATFQESNVGPSAQVVLRSGEFIPRPPYGKYALGFPEPVICSRLLGLTFPSTTVMYYLFSFSVSLTLCRQCPLLLGDNLGCTDWLESTTEVCILGPGLQ